MPAARAQDLHGARQAVERLLGELGLPAYLYTLEEGESGWTLKVEYALDHDWRTVVLTVDPRMLAASLRDPALHEGLKLDWQSAFATAPAG